MLQASIIAEGAWYHCVASLWEIAGTQQLGEEEIKEECQEQPPLIKMPCLMLSDLTFILSPSCMEVHS